MNDSMRRSEGTASLNFSEGVFDESSSSDSCESPEDSDYDDDDQSLPSGSPPESPSDSDDEMDFPPPSDDESVHINGDRKHLTVNDANNAGNQDCFHMTFLTPFDQISKECNSCWS
jgi:hypothetical protein